MSRAPTGNAFMFIASKPGGGKSFGLRAARSERALAAVLRQERLVLLRSVSLPAWLAPERRLSLPDRAKLNEQLSQLLSRGVPLVEALEVAASVVSSPCRPLVLKMRERVSEGASFAEACRGTQSFDTIELAVYRAAERTGDLAGACRQLFDASKRELKIRSKAATMMVYPAVLLIVAILVISGMLVFIVPTIGQAVRENGAPTPLVTSLLIDLGLFLRANWAPALIVAAGLAFAAVLFRVPLLAAGRRAASLIPAIRSVQVTQESARFFSTLAALSRSGVPLADALGVAVDAVSEPKMQRELRDLRTKLVQGGVLRNLIEKVGSLPIAERRLLVAADRAGDLDAAFTSLTEDLTLKLEEKTARLLALLEPLLIITLFAIIGSMLLAIYLPMLTMTSQAEI